MATIRELQDSLHRTQRYADDFEANPQPHKGFHHVVLHVLKAGGRLAGLCEELDHVDVTALTPSEYTKYLADVVICAIHAAQEFPGGPVDLEAVINDRVKAKYPK